MKFALTSAAWIGLAVFLQNGSLLAQLRDNSEKQMTCENGNRNGDQARHCEIREQTLPSIGRLSLDASQNGGATVKGWLRSDMLVRARVEGSADTEAAAATMASQVSITNSGGEVKALGPERGDNASWSVSYEIFVPQTTDLTIKAHNGGISVSDVRGQIHFEGHNGGVHLKRVAGDVTGSTVNGGVQVELTGAIWEGHQLEVSTQNGGVSINMPSSYSAHVQAETRNGHISSDFPMMLADGATRPRKVEFNIGSGGPVIHLTTVNGGVSLKKAEAQ
jgi:DUF4097 and DUF4098 domain-containing protein YvlB